MTLQQTFRRFVGNQVRPFPRLYEMAKGIENRIERFRHIAAEHELTTIRPRPYKIMIAITAHCNARCKGCRYGRDFMPGKQLSWPTVRDLLDDAKDAGYYSIRFYGGEPLLHPDLPLMVKHCADLGMRPYVTTNGVLLGEKVDALVEAGLRDVTFGFYGVGGHYDEYTQRPGLFDRVADSIAKTRQRHGNRLQMQMNWLLMRPTASIDAFHAALAFARQHGMTMRIDLIHYSLPYFQEGPNRMLQFRPQDRPVIEEVVREIIAVKKIEPTRIQHSLEGLRSIPDWLIKGPAMKVPCTAYEMLWVGADGTVQMCYVKFQLGNLHQRRLRDMIFTKEHHCAARDAFALNCPNCHCSSNERILRHAPSVQKYSARAERSVRALRAT